MVRRFEWKMRLGMVYRFDGDVRLVEKALRSGLLLLIIGLLILFVDLRIQGLNLLPDSIGALLSLLGIRRITLQNVGTQKMLTYLRRSLYALTGATVFMVPDIFQTGQGPGFVVQFYPSSAVLLVFWVGSIVCELVAVLYLSLAVGAWASIFDDKSLEGLSRITFRLILAAAHGYVVSLSFFLVASAPGWDIAGFFAMMIFLIGIITLISRLLLICSVIRTRRTTSLVADYGFTLRPPLEAPFCEGS